MNRDIDLIIERLLALHPGLKWEQLKAANPGADDDGLWFFIVPPHRREVQIESSYGRCPFLIEDDQSPGWLTGATVESTVRIMSYLLTN